MLFYSLFKSLHGKEMLIELKNDLRIRGKLHSVDQYLNFKLTDIHVENEEKYPHLLSVTSIFIRGSVVRYVHLSKDDVELEILQDSTRKEAERDAAEAAGSK